jgi:hypothetical protein
MRRAVAIVEDERHLGHVARRPARRARKDHVVHAGAAHALGRGLAHHPAQGFDKIGFAAAVRPDDAAAAGLDRQLGRVDERLEAGQTQPRNLHGHPVLLAQTITRAATASGLGQERRENRLESVEG